MINAAARGEGPKRRAKAAQFVVGMLDWEFAAPPRGKALPIGLSLADFGEAEGDARLVDAVAVLVGVEPMGRSISWSMKFAEGKTSGPLALRHVATTQAG